MPISEQDFKDAQDHASQLQGQYSTRLSMLQEIENIYLLIDDGLPDEDWIKETLSPDGRNKVDGARRLLTATSPKWSVPPETNTAEVADISDQLERAAATTWRRAGILQNRPRHYDPALSGVLYGEVQMALKSTKALAALSQGNAKLRADRAARQIPVLYETVNPKYGYPSWDELGLNAYASKRDMTVSALRGLYGPAVAAAKKLTDVVSVWDYWNLDYHCIWMDGESAPIVAEENKRGYIPIVAVTCEGSALFTDSGQYQTQPLLYTVWKSNLWKRQNLYMTIAASLTFEIGANPLLVFTGNSQTVEPTPPRIDYSLPGGMIALRQGESLTPLLQRILDPTMQAQASEIDRRFEASTIYAQTLGEPLGANAPFSMVHLLSQSGRLPLVVYQRMISFALSQAMQQTFQVAREDNFKLMASSKTGLSELEASEIPEDFDLQCDLDIDMPQDERLNLQIAVEGVKMGLFSLKYGREHYLNIEQSDAMDDEIAEEQFAAAMVQQQMAQLAQGGQQQPAGPAPAPGGQPPEQGGTGQMPPELAAMMGGASDGMPGVPMQEPMGSPMGPGGEPQEGVF